MTINPTELEYVMLDPGCAPKYGVSISPSKDFHSGSKYVFAWFTNLGDAEHFAKSQQPSCRVIWDLEEGRIIP